MTTQVEALWAEERIFARLAILNQGSSDPYDTLEAAGKVLREMNDEYEAERTQLLARIAESVEYARCMEADAIYAAAYLDAVAPGYNPSLELQTTVQMQANEIAELLARIAELEQQLAALDTVQGGEWEPSRNELFAEIGELRQSNRELMAGAWLPVDGDIEGDDTLIVKNGTLLVLTEIGEMTVGFPTGYAVCRRTTPQPSK